MFGVPVEMSARFRAPAGCDCHCGEYRQFVRGTFTKDGVNVPSSVCSGPLDPQIFREDCTKDAAFPGGERKYGYHSIPWSGASTFSDPDQATGCSFEGKDTPGFPVGSGAPHHYEIHLDFQSKLVDACNNDRVLVQRNWGVDGDGIGQG